ncbi:MAG: ArsR family transcriptional regulator [Thaumarchaeota archaeon]|nr:ArsR family transcriptional regulator [Nitrososphaerota archaeon]MCY3975596.1 ArsR family transcriptional regulator [Nitrososphaerota archaeon]
MNKKLTITQKKKFDITQRIIEALTDIQSRTIIFSIIKKGKTATELSDKYKIPLSSVYKKLTDLEELSLIRVEQLLISDSGRKFKIFKSRISKANIIIKTSEPILTLIPN